MSRIFSRLKALPQQKNSVSAQPQAVPTAPADPVLTPVEPEIPTEAVIPPATPVITEAPEVPVTPEIPVTPVMAVAPDTKLFPIILILGIAIAVVMLSLLGVLSFNVAAIKNQTLVGINEKIRQQQDQILILNKKLVLVQSSVDDRVQKSETAAKEIGNSLENKLEDLNNSVESKLDQNTANMNHAEAVLQSNIDELNSKLNKLQMSALEATSNTTDQTKTVTSN